MPGKLNIRSDSLIERSDPFESGSYAISVRRVFVPCVEAPFKASIS